MDVELLSSQVDLCENIVTDLMDEITTLKAYFEELKAEGGESEKNATHEKMPILSGECGKKERAPKDTRVYAAGLAMQVLPETIYRYCFITKEE